ncbi:Polyribonucleotide 5'-hydroxyl-kinase Clp1 [Araneus ventricosus]|uniref:Polyribonucleotide 5'-hydroxyl-kinase Clp1 n=1 Tax=Araneus ventricosus TaxID=182803 RepID=A0A4Y2GB25_ARAVE|nr:Polyribonucleotide 5'-hydroxyl-kinase Clp1 [Araneus ventricosus]
MAENAFNKQSVKLEVRNEFLGLARENSTDNKESFTLEEENELRLLVGGNSTDVKIELSSGLAEIYGTEMELNKEYSLSPYSSISVFTWHGCVINVSGNPEAAYVVKDTAMILNVILHASLEERRLQAEAENKKGPVIFVVGPNDVDKSSLCRLLLNYAIRLGRRPLFIDLDVGQNSISLPSTVGVLTAEKPADIVTGFNDQAVQVYQYGHRSAWQSIIFYYLLLQRLGLTVRSDVKQKNRNVRTSGMIISGCDWSRCEIRHHGYDAITLVAMHFEIDIVCVLQEERLYLQLQNDMPSSVEVIFIPKLDGVERNREIKSQSREARIREYFYGPTNQLQPFTFEVKYSDIQVFQVVARSVKRNTHFLSDIKENEAKLRSVTLGSKLVDQILGLSCADEFQEDIMYMPVIGFICIINVNLETGTITVLSPQPGPLPKKILLKGDTRLKKSQ